MKKLAAILISTALSLILAEAAVRLSVWGGAYFVKRIVEPYDYGEAYGGLGPVIYNPTLGWALNPRYNGRGAERSKIAGGEIGLLGRRGEIDYSPDPVSDPTVVAAFGDSFTFGFEIAADQSWPAVLSRLNNSRQVHNFGCPGYGTDQAWLNFRRIKIAEPEFRFDIVLIGFTVENLRRHVNILRPAYSMASGLPFTKPRFIINEGELKPVNLPATPPDELEKIIGNPETAAWLEYEHYPLPAFAGSTFQFLYSWRLVSQVVAHLVRSSGAEADYLESFKPGSESYEITRMILENFVTDIKKIGARPIIVVLPTALDLRLGRQGTPPQRELTSRLAADRIELLDLAPALGEALDSGETYESLFINGAGHFTPAAAEVVARRIDAYLNEMKE